MFSLGITPRKVISFLLRGEGYDGLREFQSLGRSNPKAFIRC